MGDEPTEREMRASDLEREHVVEQLSAACAEGRLDLEELSSRVEAAYRATSRGELAPLVADLPESAPGALAEAPEKRRGERTWVVAIMGSVSREGHWSLKRRANVVTVMGEAKVDLRQAVIDSPEVEMTLWTLMGSQTVYVPEGVDVEVTGPVVMGERKVNVHSVRRRPGVPRITLKVRCVMGEVVVETR